MKDPISTLTQLCLEQPFSPEGIRAFEQFDYRVVWGDRDFDLLIIDRQTGKAVAKG